MKDSKIQSILLKDPYHMDETPKFLLIIVHSKLKKKSSSYTNSETPAVHTYFPSSYCNDRIPLHPTHLLSWRTCSPLAQDFLQKHICIWFFSYLAHPVEAYVNRSSKIKAILKDRKKKIAFVFKSKGIWV